jgi:hypothetical protein
VNNAVRSPLFRYCRPMPARSRALSDGPRLFRFDDEPLSLFDEPEAEPDFVSVWRSEHLARDLDAECFNCEDCDDASEEPTFEFVPDDEQSEDDREREKERAISKAVSEGRWLGVGKLSPPATTSPGLRSKPRSSPTSKPVRCTEPDCDRRFTSDLRMRVHIGSSHRFAACPCCGEMFSRVEVC